MAAVLVKRSIYKMSRHPKLPNMIIQPLKISESLHPVQELNRFADTVQVKSNFETKKSS